MNNPSNFNPPEFNSNLQDLIEDGATLLDVRGKEEFASFNLKGSINIPFDEIENNLSKLEHKKYIIVYCSTGENSAKAKELLNSLGINSVIIGGSYSDIAKYI